MCVCKPSRKHTHKHIPTNTHSENDEFSEEATLGQIMLATTEYSIFMRMMRDFKLENIRAAHK